MIFVAHRRDPTIRKQATERTRGEIHKCQALLTRKRVEIVSNSVIRSQRHLGINHASKEQRQTFAPEAAFCHRLFVSLVSFCPDQNSELTVDRVATPNIERLTMVLFQFISIIAIDAPLDLQGVFFAQNPKENAKPFVQFVQLLDAERIDFSRLHGEPARDCSPSGSTVTEPDKIVKQKSIRHPRT
jgi:hypothetical protein